MAKPDVSDAAFLREVDEEYRRSQLAGLWSRYGRWIVIGVAVLLVAVAGTLYWRAERTRRAGLQGEQLTLALAKVDAGDTAGAAPLLADLAQASQPGYRALAQFAQAAVALQANDRATARKRYDAVAGADAVAPPLRDLATLKAVRLDYDTLSPAQIIARLQRLSVPGNPWFAVAGEMTAVAQLHAGKPALAGALFAAIARDTTAPASSRARAAQMAQSLGVKLADTNPVLSGTAR